MKINIGRGQSETMKRTKIVANLIAILVSVS